MARAWGCVPWGWCQCWGGKRLLTTPRVTPFQSVLSVAMVPRVVAQRILDVPPETVANEWALLDQDEKRALIDALFTIELAAPGTKENAYKDWRKRIVNPETVIVTLKQQGKVA